MRGSAHRGHNARACARRVTSVCRSPRSASTGVPGSESSAWNNQSKASCSLNPPSNRTVSRPGRCRSTAPSCRKSAGILLLPLPGTAISLCSRSSWRTRLGETPRRCATSAGVSVSIGCQPMASGDGTANDPRLTQRQRSADEPARTPDDPHRELPFLDLDALERQARDLLPADVYDYYAGGSGEEITLTEARAAWRAWRLRPRVLRDVPAVQLGTSLLGTEVATPIGVAPWAYQGMAHPDGERATARGAAAAGALMTVSTSANTALADVAAVQPPGPRWFQLYRLHSPAPTEALA